MWMTYQPKKRQRAKVHGFRSRMSTKGEERFFQQDALRVDISLQFNYKSTICP